MARIPDLVAAKRTLSFEFFPPKTSGAHMTLGRTVAELEALEPDFVSITYGAGGSDRHRTGDVVEWMRAETGWTPMPHLTCRGHSRADVALLLDNYQQMGIENILALAGDPPRDGADEAGDYRYAIDVATTLCSDLIEAGTPGLHLYALNRPDSVVQICMNLDLAAP
jgi:methylenetetrahydrofolate reductase (NADPH)